VVAPRTKRPQKSTTPFHGARRTVVDAAGVIVGRLASYVAKSVLAGEEIVVVNAEKAVITGRKKSVVEAFKAKLGTRTLGSQTKAPKHPRRPETYVRRVVRGMLPWKTPKGKQAYRRLKVYLGVPRELKDAVTQTFPDAVKDIRPSMTVGELMCIFGWNNPLEARQHAP
jgi:large subunit ribosomal protein L13